MKVHIACCAGAALLLSTLAIAQDSVPSGKYSGMYNSNRDTQVRISIDIKSVENGAVKGTIERYSSSNRGGQCSGVFPLEGTLKDNQLRVRTAEGGGATSDCVLRLNATVEGGKLVGKMGSNDIVLTK